MVSVKFFKDAQALDVDPSTQETIFTVPSAPPVTENGTSCVSEYLDTLASSEAVPSELWHIITSTGAIDECGVITALASATLSKFREQLALIAPPLSNSVLSNVGSFQKDPDVAGRGRLSLPLVPLAPCGADKNEISSVLTPGCLQHLSSITWAAHYYYTMALRLDEDSSVDQIRRLDLHGISIMPWGPYQKLTHLSLHDIPQQDLCPTSAELVRMLSASPHIQLISLRNLNSAHVTDDAISKVSLHDLEYFDIFGLPTATWLYITQHVNISPTAPMWKDGATNWFNITPGYFLLTDEAGKRASFEVKFEHDEIDLYLESLSEIIDLKPVTKINCAYALGPYQPFDVEKWKKFLERIPNLQEAYVSSGIPDFIVDFLRTLWQSGGSAENAFRPAFNRLSIESPSFIPPQETRALYTSLRALFEIRKRVIPKPFEELEINFGDNDMHQELRKLVKTLTINDSDLADFIQKAFV